MKLYFAGRTGFVARERVVQQRGATRRLVSYSNRADITNVVLPTAQEIRERKRDAARQSAASSR